MHADAAALRVRLALQIMQAGLRAGILRVCGIVRPREHDLTRPHKGADVVDVLVRLVAVDAARQPEDLFRAEHAAERRGDLVLRELRIAPGAQEAGLRDEQRALAVAVDGAALHHERRGIIAAEAERIQQAARKGIVLLPVGVQAVDLAAPGVEAPVDAAHRAVGGPADKCRGNVARPGIVAVKVQQADAVRAAAAPFFHEPGRSGQIRMQP